MPKVPNALDAGNGSLLFICIIYVQDVRILLYKKKEPEFLGLFFYNEMRYTPILMNILPITQYMLYPSPRKNAHSSKVKIRLS